MVSTNQAGATLGMGSTGARTGIARQTTPVDAGQPQRDGPRRGGVVSFRWGRWGRRMK